jgi:hypothetical protein
MMNHIMPVPAGLRANPARSGDVTIFHARRSTQSPAPSNFHLQPDALKPASLLHQPSRTLLRKTENREEIGPEIGQNSRE